MQQALRANLVLGVLLGPLASAGALLAPGGNVSPFIIVFALPSLMPFALIHFAARRAGEVPGDERAATDAAWLSTIGVSALSAWTCWSVATVHGTGSQFAILAIPFFPMMVCGALVVLFPLLLWMSKSFGGSAAGTIGVGERNPAELPPAATASHGEAVSVSLDAEELALLAGFLNRRGSLDPGARSHLAQLLATRFAGRRGRTAPADSEAFLEGLTHTIAR